MDQRVPPAFTPVWLPRSLPRPCKLLRKGGWIVLDMLRALVSALVVAPVLAVLDVVDRVRPIDEDPHRPDGW